MREWFSVEVHGGDGESDGGGGDDADADFH